MADKKPYPLQGMTAVVTGGAGAIGSATAAVLVRDGANVVIAGRTAENLQRVADSLQDDARGSGGSISWHAGSALDEQQIKGLVAKGESITGRLDMAVNVVGGRGEGGGVTAPVLRYSVEMLESTLRQNIVSAFLLLKHAGAAMVRGGGGSYVAVSSMQATQTAPLLAAYCAAKAGLEMLLKVGADELGRHDVRVNMVRPGLTNTGAATHQSNDERAMAAYYEQQALQKQGHPGNIAAAIRYFLGPEAAWTTGVAMPVDGGNSLRRFPDLESYWHERMGEEMDKAARGEVD